MSIAVYPKTIVYCPKNKQEQDGDSCKVCKFFAGYQLNTEELYIKCEFDD